MAQRSQILQNNIDVSNFRYPLKLHNINTSTGSSFQFLTVNNDQVEKYDLNGILQDHDNRININKNNIDNLAPVVIANQQLALTNQTDIFTILNNNPGMTFSNDSYIKPVGTNRLEYSTMNSHLFKFTQSPTAQVNLKYVSGQTILDIDNVEIDYINGIDISNYLNTTSLQSGTFSPTIQKDSRTWVSIQPINYILVGTTVMFNGIMKINELVLNNVNGVATTQLINNWPYISDNNFIIHYTLFNDFNDKIEEANLITMSKNVGYNSVRVQTHLDGGTSQLTIRFSGSYQTI